MRAQMALGLTSALTFTVSEVVSEVVDWIYTMPRKQDQDETNKGSVESEPPQKRSPPPRPFKAFFSDLPDGTEWIKTMRQEDSKPPVDIGRIVVCSPDATEETLKAHGFPGVCADGQEKIKVVLEGGAAFGTGEHPTTSLCLGWLQSTPTPGGECLVSGKRVLDYGSGSGILGLAAVALGAVQAVGVEADPRSMEASLRNAAANGAESLEYFLPPAPASNGADPFADGVSGVSGVSGGLVPVSLDGLAAAAARHRGLTGSKRLLRLPFEPERGDATRYSGFDLCAVNMRPGSLLGAAQTIARLVRPGGVLGLSGVLQGQAEAIFEAYHPYFSDLAVSAERDGWLLITGTRSSGE